MACYGTITIRGKNNWDNKEKLEGNNRDAMTTAVMNG